MIDKNQQPEDLSGASEHEKPVLRDRARGDHGLAVLLSVRDRLSCSIPSSLVEHCYKVQREHQYTQDKQVPLSMTRDVVEEYVKKNLSEAGGDDL